MTASGTLLLVPSTVPCGPWAWSLPGTASAHRFLVAHGVQQGTRLALGGLNLPATPAILLAASALGACVVLIHRRLPPEMLRQQIAASAVDRCIAHAEHPLAQLPGCIALPDAFSGANHPIDDTGTDADPALVLFTSGTTGTAKAARLSRRALLAAARSAVEHLALNSDDCWWCPLPLDHIGGASVAYRAATCGMRIVLSQPSEARDNAIIDAMRCTGASLVPTQLLRQIEARRGMRWPEHLRCLLVGGGPLSEALAQASTALGCAPSQTYGLTEAGSQVTTLLPMQAAAGIGTAGTPLPHMHISIERADRTACATNEPGEIVIRGPNLFDGYERDGQLIEPCASPFRTGDWGSIDAHGRLRVLTRRDDLIVSGGENVYPAAVEAALQTHAAVQDVCVVGVADDEWGQRVVAAIVLIGDDHTAFEQWVTTQLAAHMLPKEYQYVAELPRTALGKLQRHIVRGWFSARADGA